MNESEYKPISCSSYDEFESLSVMKTPVEIIYLNEGLKKTVNGFIVDVFSKNSAEYIKMDSGENIRLDTILFVNGNEIKKYC